MISVSRPVVLLVAMVLTLGLAACETPIETHYEYDTKAHFGEYESYAWITDEPLLERPVGFTEEENRLSPMLEQEIRSAVDTRLTAKRYEKRSDPESADLVVSFSVGMRPKVEVDSYPARSGYRYGPHGGRGEWVSDVYSYTEGTLAIDIFDRRTKRAVWHGWASARVQPPSDPETRRERVDRAVEGILSEFPSRNPLRTD